MWLLLFYIVFSATLVAGIITLLKWATREDRRAPMKDPEQHDPVLGKVFDAIVDPIRKFRSQ